MPDELDEMFRTSKPRHTHDSYEYFDRLAYHLSNLTSDDGHIENSVDAEYGFDALVAAVTDLFDAFDVDDENAQTLLRRSLERTNMNSHVGLELELHVGDRREGLEIEFTELVRTSGDAQVTMFNLRERDKIGTRSRESIAEFREAVLDARRESASIRIKLQRMHDDVRFGWETFDRANEAVLTTNSDGFFLGFVASSGRQRKTPSSI